MDRMLMQAFITGMVVGAIVTALLLGAIWVVAHAPEAAHPPPAAPHWSP